MYICNCNCCESAVLWKAGDLAITKLTSIKSIIIFLLLYGNQLIIKVIVIGIYHFHLKDSPTACLQEPNNYCF